MRFAEKFWIALTLMLLMSAPAIHLLAQEDAIRTGTGIGVDRIRLAVSSMRAGGDVSALMRTFDETLWNDLDFAGFFDLASKSFYPLSLPSRPAELKLEEWSGPPVSAHMVVLGNAVTMGEQVLIEAYLVDPRNATQPVVLGKRYAEEPTERAVRQAAHRFANEIVFRLGGGVPGVAESKVVFVRRTNPRVKEIWIMDYDGSNQEQITHLDTLCLTPAISVDGTQVAFTTYKNDNPEIMIYSLLTRKQLPFSNRRGLNTTPTWSPDGSQMAITSSVTGDPEIYIVDLQGKNFKRLTVARGVDISPSWNPKTGTHITFVSDRGGSPKIYMMDNDGANVTPLVTEGVQALDPAWSPNGRLIAFTLYKDGEYNINIMDVATRNIVQLTRNNGKNEHPSWSPDNRHIVFTSNRTGMSQIWTMIADGSKQRQLTTRGDNTEPAWSSR
ncbi:MAG: Tol-Pal system beta propeller repeat protein TolB [Acidobacteria bacterium RIFCSPLOWO2_12_FULL_54_10]|nr:MAG: Tol-Pal system beta propeller repeat protein TolB [Acidobacteria bacterium RIFCSPLOWO2_12_FULL_54_10]